MLWLLSDKIKIYQYAMFFPDFDIVMEKYPQSSEYTKQEMIIRIADKMWEDGIIEFESEKDSKLSGERIRAKVYAIKIR